MPAWATVALTLGATVLGGLIALAGTVLTNKNAVESREATERADRRARGGRVVGRIRLLLIDASPEVLAMNINGVGDAAMPDVLARWRTLRDELAVFAEGDADPAVRDAAMELTVEIENAFNRIGGVLFDRKAHTGMGAEILKSARENYANARSLLEKLADLIRA